MSEVDYVVMDVQDETERYLYHIEEALGSSDVVETRRHVQESTLAAQSIIENLEELMNSTEDPDVADSVEEAVQHLVMSIDQADLAMDVSEDEIEDILLEMRRHAERACALVSELA